MYEANLENGKFIRNLNTVNGDLESPIDLDIGRMKVIQLNPLKWANVHVAPRKVKITNTGYTVILSAKWQHDRPFISGGPLAADYTFSQMHFHWGENEMHGSEHTIDGASMPMELHVVHFKSEYETLDTALRRPDGVTVLVYFIKLQNEPNTFLEEIVKHLSDIQSADSAVRIVPKQLSSFIKPFEQNYFLYWGSLITISNRHKILWLISREPIGVALEQIAGFRTLTNKRGVPILSNLRASREIQNRDVFHVCPSNSIYASLLPIPRNFPSVETNETGDTANDTPTKN
ncbi:carbonic anhydrase 1 [Ptiloglossa arizonensis]|uniref:carbonic anhydrase 1 n=1 Tax=Ptiloglossa arizonensis TaxID=3350558 RepID=UPI003FA01497